MNIKFGDNNFYVRYLKRFLSSELNNSNSILGEFDRNDLKLLVQYLNLPNVKTMFEVSKDMEANFDKLTDLFTVYLKDNEIIYTSKNICVEASEYITGIRSKIVEYCQSAGWELSDMQMWIDTSKDINQDGIINQEDRDIIYNIIYNVKQYDSSIKDKSDIDRDGEVTLQDLALFDEYLNTGRVTFTIKRSNRTNYFPNKEMLVFINQFEGTFLQGYEIAGNDQPQPDPTKMHKIGIFKCTPGQKITIAHNSNKTTRLVIGCAAVKNLEELKNFSLKNVVDINLKPGQGYQYTATSRIDGTGINANYICIQCPSDYDNLSGSTNTTVTLQVGDINFDGKIDMLDYHLLARYTATGPGSEELKWTPTPKQLAVMNCDVENEPKGTISNKDTVRLYKYITGDPSVVSLGTAMYTYDTDSEMAVDNVSNLLIIDGHYDKDVNIPFNEFMENDWVIHDKFFNYLLGMAVHKYSPSENITYLQKLLKEVYPEHIYDESFFYPSVYSDNMRKLVSDYQHSKLKYTLGDLNRDNSITEEDLVMLRTYLDEAEDLNLTRDILDGKIELTTELLLRLDQNLDGRLTETDYSMLKERINSKYSTIFIQRADVNQDAVIDELDFDLLKKAVDGKTNELKSYDISFILGWYDVQTENLLETEVNTSMNISEVSK